MRILEKLTVKRVTHVARPGRYGDGGGLWLQVTGADGGVTKSWLFRYECANGGYRPAESWRVANRYCADCRIGT